MLPRAIWMLGFVSLFMDVSSEMIHSLLPAFLVTTFGTSPLALGFMEGLAEATALIVKVFSGTLSDVWGKRKSLAVVGYALGAIAKPGFALASSVGAVWGARLVDRVGKGIRGAPRDALVADLVPPELRGAAYGLRQSLDTTGALLGPLLASALMFLWQDDFRSVFAIAVIPACLSVALLAFGVREPEHRNAAQRPRFALDVSTLRGFNAYYWFIVALGALIHLARFSEAFLILRAQELRVPLAELPLVLGAMSLTYAASAYPFGRFSDVWSPRALLVVGMFFLVTSTAVLALSSSKVHVFLGVGLWGVHLGATQGLLAAQVARHVPAELRGTAFGVFNLVAGGALLASGLLAGALWNSQGGQTTFLVASVLAFVTLLLLLGKRGARAISP